ncbi:zinc ribbon domain-containing protein [Candidatus Omnitrophota bacterium]
MKRCPYCAEEIQDGAIKCKHCGEFLNKKRGDRWYFKTYFLIIAFLCVGPFMLPLVWLKPDFDQKKKIIMTIIVIILSYCLGILFANSVKTINAYYQQIF